MGGRKKGKTWRAFFWDVGLLEQPFSKCNKAGTPGTWHLSGELLKHSWQFVFLYRPSSANSPYLHHFTFSLFPFFFSPSSCHSKDSFTFLRCLYCFRLQPFTFFFFFCFIGYFLPFCPPFSPLELGLIFSLFILYSVLCCLSFAPLKPIILNFKHLI